jgi:hypothetical protein
MATQTLIRSFTAGGTINPRRLVKFGSNDREVVQAAAATDLIVGVCVSPEVRSAGDRVDVALGGIADVDMGGTVARGTKVTSDANGKGVAAAPSAGTNNHVVGFAMVTTASGDIAEVVISQSVNQG